jgi:hypothetical protein
MPCGQTSEAATATTANAKATMNGHRIRRLARTGMTTDMTRRYRPIRRAPELPPRCGVDDASGRATGEPCCASQ